MNITIKTIPHKDQRYPTVGDWDANNILISKMGNELFEFLIALHELIERQWCSMNNVTEQQVTDFDLMFEQERLKNIHEADDEPGDDPRCPYGLGHKMATGIEKQVLQLFGGNWDEYNTTVLKVGNQSEAIMSDDKDTANKPALPEKEEEQGSQPEGAEASAGGEHPEDA
jgi:hypothetical protein